ncbi:unnamed protein product [Amoebophrya sp. A120]|nr:unnamed protein product [Amoebophrya sp. A120]|eukprot:GSA120T00019719001.1
MSLQLRHRNGWSTSAVVCFYNCAGPAVFFFLQLETREDNKNVQPLIALVKLLYEEVTLQITYSLTVEDCGR